MVDSDHIPTVTESTHSKDTANDITAVDEGQTDKGADQQPQPGESHYTSISSSITQLCVN